MPLRNPETCPPACAQGNRVAIRSAALCVRRVLRMSLFLSMNSEWCVPLFTSTGEIENVSASEPRSVRLLCVEYGNVQALCAAALEVPAAVLQVRCRSSHRPLRPYHHIPQPLRRPGCWGYGGEWPRPTSLVREPESSGTKSPCRNRLPRTAAKLDPRRASRTLCIHHFAAPDHALAVAADPGQRKVRRCEAYSPFT
jgi:hypothetical protein